MIKNLCAFVGAMCLSALYAPALLWAEEPVVWNGASGVSVSANNLTKTNQVSSWNAGAASMNVIRDGYGFVEFTATETNAERMAGLSYGDSDQNYPDIDFAIYLTASAGVQIYEGGTYRGSYGGYAAGDRLRVEVRYGIVRYLRNGSLLYTSGGIPKYPLRVDTSLKNPGATLTNVRVGNLVMSNGAGVVISGEKTYKIRYGRVERGRLLDEYH